MACVVPLNGVGFSVLTGALFRRGGFLLGFDCLNYFA